MFGLPVIGSTANFNIDKILFNQHIFLQARQALISLTFKGLVSSTG